MVVQGHVQGVGYRYATRRQARRRELSGWVRNLPDGSVESEVEGTPEMVASMLRWFHAGPPDAVVTSVDREELAPQDEPGPSDAAGEPPPEFRILR